MAPLQQLVVATCVILNMMLSIVMVSSSSDVPVSWQPEQIHLSVTGKPTEMMVTWNTMNSTKTSVVKYSLGGGNSSLVAYGRSTLFKEPVAGRIQYIHRVLLSGLKPGIKYTYHCGSPHGWSSLFFFTALPCGTDWSPRFALYGDLGNDNPQSLGRLQEETQRGLYDAVLHLGDFAYDMYEDESRVGDSFMRQIEPVAAYVPYMTCPGNHEFRYNFTNYKERFTMPMFNQSQNLWYSWDIGPAHIISFSSEVYFFFIYGIQQLENQLKWLKADLQEANKNRDERPWIITMAHRPFYCSTTDHDDCDKEKGLLRMALEKLFYDNGVDLELWAHEHIYQRLWPVYNEKVYNGTTDSYTDPKAPVHIITGSAGNREGHDGFGPASPWDAFRNSDFGYTRMFVHNKTHLSLEQVSDDQDGKVIDRITIVKNKHGPYKTWL